MSYKIKIIDKTAIATFSENVEENEISNAFITIVEEVSVQTLDYLIFDYTNIISYTIPKDYLKTLKTITQFSSTWNTNITVLIVATHPNIRTVTSKIMTLSDQFDWKYLLFEDLENAKKWCAENS